MKQVSWLIEKNIFDREAEFIDLLNYHGCEYRWIDYLRFRPADAKDYYHDGACVIFRGSLNLGRNILRTSWIPGVYMNEKALSCSTYYTYLGKYLLNNQYFLLPLGELMRRKSEILDYFCSDGELFIRPNSNMKTFRAGIFNLNQLNTVAAIKSELGSDPTVLVLVSRKQNIQREWRFFIYKQQVITGSLYLVGEEEVHEQIQTGYLIDYVERVLKSVDWYPEQLYSLDICKVNNELFVLELGSYSCAGEYGCDLGLLIEAGNNAAWEDFQLVNGD